MNLPLNDRPEAVFSVEQVRAIDRNAIERCGIPALELMSRAGAAAFEVLVNRWPDARSICICCGAGNNAGDGFIVARLAHRAGLDVTVIRLTEEHQLPPAAATAYQDCAAAQVPIIPWEELQHGDRINVKPVDVYVDGLLGTGLSRPVTDPYAAVIALMNDSGVPVLALDIPSGIDADTGDVLGVALKATVTVTFVGQKLGLFLGLARDLCGDIEFSDLSIPASAYASIAPPMRRLTTTVLRDWLPDRPRAAHKGNHGRLLLIGGGPQMGGAIALAGEAALRAGAGLVHVATAPANVSAIVARRPELICHGVESAAALQDLELTVDAIAIGPGLGQNGWAETLFDAFRMPSVPTVVDADGLNLLAAAPRRSNQWVLTPHPGEAARLLATSTGRIEADRTSAVRQIAHRYGGTVVLKGACTLVAEAEGALSVCDAGNPGMATAGMGDVLTGVIAGLLAQGLPLARAARAGVLVHALAGDAAARSGGQRGLIASDLMASIRQQLNP